MKCVYRSLSWIALVLLAAPAVHASPASPQVSIVGGSGMPGDTVAVAIELADDAAGAAASVDLDIAYPADLVSIEAPVRTSCRVDPRLESSHQIGGRIPDPGLLRLAVFARGLTISPVGDGPVATCDFAIAADADATSAPLTPEYLGLGDNTGDLLPVDGVAGAIAIVAQSAMPTEPPNQCLPGCGSKGTPTATPVPEPAPRCVADCNGDGMVTVNEIVSSISVALGRAPLSACPASDRDGDSSVLIGDLIDGVGGALGGCRP